MAEGQLQQEFATICDQMQQNNHEDDSQGIRQHSGDAPTFQDNMTPKDLVKGPNEGENGPLMSKEPRDSSHQNAQGEPVDQSMIDALNPEHRSNQPAGESCSNIQGQQNMKLEEQTLILHSQPAEENQADMAHHLAKEHQNEQDDSINTQVANQNGTEENAEEHNGDSEESSNGAALNESGSRRSLRRTTRVKTAKNNSEFIYFGKYNKELMKPKSYSKTNQQPGQSHIEQSSQFQSRTQLNAPKAASNKRNVVSNCQQANQGNNSKKMSGMNQFSSQNNDGIALPQDDVTLQKNEKDLSNDVIQPDNPLKRPQSTENMIDSNMVSTQQKEQGLLSQQKLSEEMNQAVFTSQNDNINQNLQVNIKQMDYCETNKEQLNHQQSIQSQHDKFNKSNQSMNTPLKYDSDAKDVMIEHNKDANMNDYLNNTAQEQKNSQITTQNAQQNANTSQLVVSGDLNTENEPKMQSQNQSTLKHNSSYKNDNNSKKDVPMTSELQQINASDKDIQVLKSISKINDEKMTPMSNSKLTRNNLRSNQNSQKEVVLNKKITTNSQKEPKANSVNSQSEGPSKDKSSSAGKKLEDKKSENIQSLIEIDSEVKQQKQVYCICRTTDEQNMICCDICEEWYHFHCVGIKPEEITEYDNKPYYCQKCLDNKKKNQSKKSQAKETDEKKNKQDKKTQKQIEIDQKSNNRKTGEQNSSDNGAQRLQASNNDKKKIKNIVPKGNNTSNDVHAVAEPQQKKSNKDQSQNQIDSTLASKNSRNQAKQDNKNANKPAPAILVPKSDRKAKNESQGIESKSSITQSVINNKKLQKESKNNQIGQSNVKPNQSNRSKTVDQSNQSNTQQDQSNQKLRVSQVENDKNKTSINNQHKNGSKLQKKENSHQQLNQINGDKSISNKFEKESRIASLIDKNQTLDGISSLKNQIGENNLAKLKTSSQLNDIIKRDGRPTGNKRKDKMVIKEVLNQQIIKDKAFEDDRDERGSSMEKKNQFDEVSNQKSQQMNQNNSKMTRDQALRKDQNLIQDNQIGNGSKQSRKFGRDRKFYGSYVQSGQRALQGQDMASKPMNYPAMFSFQTLGMTAPNILMSGGINNLISNIKQLNLQMSAAIIQAEKMSRLNKMNAASQPCCKCSQQAQANKDLMAASNDITAVKHAQIGQMNQKRNQFSNFDDYSIDQLLQQADSMENKNQFEASLNTLLKRQKIKHDNVAKQRPSQHEKVTDKIPIEIEQIYQNNDQIMRDHDSPNQQNKANNEKLNESQAQTIIDNVSKDISQNKQNKRNFKMLVKNEIGETELQQQKARLMINPNEVNLTNLFKNSSSTKGYSSDDDERQKVANAAASKSKELLTQNNNQNKELEAYSYKKQENVSSADYSLNQHRINATLNNTRQQSNQFDFQMNNEESSQQNYQQIHEFLQEVVSTDPQEFQTLAMALHLDENEMEQEARVRLAEENDRTLAAQQDMESIKLMKQALLLEKILANFDDANQTALVNQVHQVQNGSMTNQRESQTDMGDTPSNQMHHS